MITAGEVLKNKRESLNKDLNTVSLDTKIQKRFLQYIENDQFSHFDSEVFLTGFIKIYARYLDLDINKILALYRRSNPTRKKDPVENIKKNHFRKDISQKILQPKTLVTISSIIFLFLILGYIGFQIYKFQTPPELNIIEPNNDFESYSEEIVIKGETEINCLVEVNGELTEIDEEGTFEKSLTLKEGVNIITVKSRKNSNNTLETVATVKIIFTKENQPEEIENNEEITPQNTLTLEIIESPAWIKLDIDNENKLAQVVEPSKLEYSLNQRLYIITGRVSNTKLYWNGELIEWKPNQITGVAELTCEILENSISCN